MKMGQWSNGVKLFDVLMMAVIVARPRSFDHFRVSNFCAGRARRRTRSRRARRARVSIGNAPIGMADRRIASSLRRSWLVSGLVEEHPSVLTL
jgi:hypothetical protein